MEDRTMLQMLSDIENALQNGLLQEIHEEKVSNISIKIEFK